MSLVTITFSESAGDIIRASRYNRNWSDFLADYNGNINNSNIAAGAAIDESKLNLNYPTHAAPTAIPFDVTMLTPGAIPPQMSSIDGVPVLVFSALAGESCLCRFIVPPEYDGSQMFLRVLGKEDSDLDSEVLFTAVTSLVRKRGSLEFMPNPITDKHTSTNTGFAVTASSALGYALDITDIDLTDASGEINGEAVIAGDLISVLLTRMTDTAGNFTLALMQVNY